MDQKFSRFFGLGKRVTVPLVGTGLDVSLLWRAPLQTLARALPVLNGGWAGGTVVDVGVGGIAAGAFCAQFPTSVAWPVVTAAITPAVPADYLMAPGVYNVYCYYFGSTGSNMYPVIGQFETYDNSGNVRYVSGGGNAGSIAFTSATNSPFQHARLDGLYFPGPWKLNYMTHSSGPGLADAAAFILGAVLAPVHLLDNYASAG